MLDDMHATPEFCRMNIRQKMQVASGSGPERHAKDIISNVVLEEIIAEVESANSPRQRRRKVIVLSDSD